MFLEGTHVVASTDEPGHPVLVCEDVTVTREGGVVTSCWATERAIRAYVEEQCANDPNGSWDRLAILNVDMAAEPWLVLVDGENMSTDLLPVEWSDTFNHYVYDVGGVFCFDVIDPE